MGRRNLKYQHTSSTCNIDNNNKPEVQYILLYESYRSENRLHIHTPYNSNFIELTHKYNKLEKTKAKINDIIDFK